MIELKNKDSIKSLNKNEKLLISTMIIILIFAINYVFVHTQQQKQLNFLKEEKQMYSSDIKLHSNKSEDYVLKENIEKLNIEKERISNKYFMNANQDQLIFLLSYLLENPDITILQYIFQENIEVIDENEIKYLHVAIPYTGNYEGLINSMKAIKYSPKKIVMDKLVTNQKSDGTIEGQMDFKIYLAGGLMDSKEFFEFAQLNIDLLMEDEKDLKIPFKIQENIIENKVEELPKSIEKSLVEFNADNIHFISTHEFITGNISKSNIKKFNKSSLRVEYNILAIEDKNYGFIDLSRDNINLKFPPEKIGLWIYAYDYSPLNIGILLKGQLGEEYYIPFTEGVGWIGWNYVELKTPKEIELYPLNLEKIYLQLAEGRSDYGIILINNLSAIYENLNETINKNQYIFHIVEENETIEDISIRYFNSTKFTKDILKLNEISSMKEIKVGKILLIKR